MDRSADHRSCSCCTEIDVIALNILDRQLHVVAPNRKWIADFNSVWTAEAWFYVAAVIDLFSRRAGGWLIGATNDSPACNRCASHGHLEARRPFGSAQYTSEQFRSLIEDSGVTCSMTKSGNVWDNTAMEILFSTLRTNCAQGLPFTQPSPRRCLRLHRALL